MKRLVVATRKSPLALAQARAWMKTLAARGIETEELHVVTKGDREQRVALSSIGGKGVFIKEIEEALVDRRADIAVHSMKDVPGELAPGLAIGCVPEREDPRDIMVTRSGALFAQLPEGVRVGTSSLRRATQLRRMRADIQIVPIRGNVDTRLRKCDEGEVDAVVLALAGVKRLGLAERAMELLDPTDLLPAIGQGALAVEQRESDDDVRQVLSDLMHAETQVAVSAERGVMVAAEGNCQVPIAGYACRSEGDIWLRAMLAEPDGTSMRFSERRVAWPSSADEAFALGFEVGRELKQ